MIYFVVSLITYIIYLILKGRKYITGFIKEKYDFKKIKPFNLRNYLNLEVLGLVIIILVFILKLKALSIIFIIFYTVLCIIEIRKADKRPKLDNVAKKTIITTFMIYLILFAIIVLDYYKYQTGFIFYDRVKYYYIVVIILSYLEYQILYLSLKINKKVNSKKQKK